ncbi:MAG TPA: oligosaccharide flippase family protein [Balneolaceae bacterium]
MGIIIRQSIQNTIISYLGVALGFVSTILLFPRIVTPDQFGLIRLLISLALVCAQFAHLGIKNIIIRYFPYFHHSDDSRSSLLTLAVLIPLIGFSLFILLSLFFKDTFISYYSDQSALFAEYYFYLFPLIFAVLFFEVFNSYIQALRDSVTGSFLNEVLMRTLIILLLVIYYFGFISFTEFMISFVVVYNLQPLYLLIYLFRKGELSLSLPFRNGKRRFIKGMGVYGAYSLLGGLATLLVGNIDIIMLGAMIDLSSSAVYAIAFYVGSVIAIPQRSISKIAVPLLAGMIKNKKYDEIESLYKRTSLNQIIAGSLLFVGIWANMHNLMYLLPPEYDGIQWVVIIIGAAKLFGMATGVNGGIIINSKYYRFDLYTNILLIFLTITTNYLLIPPYGIVGAATATALSIFIYNFIKVVFVEVKFSMQPFQWNALAVLLIAAGCLLLSFQIPYLYNFFIDVIVRSLIITFIFVGLILLFNLSDDVKGLVMKGMEWVRKVFHP